MDNLQTQFFNEEHFAKYTRWYTSEFILKLDFKALRKKKKNRFNTDKPTRIKLVASLLYTTLMFKCYLLNLHLNAFE